MTSVWGAIGLPPAGSDTTPLRAKWGWVLALGIVQVVAGCIALGSVVTATVASVLIVGVMMIVAGVAEIFNAFQCKGWGRFVIWLLLGGLYIVAGFATFENPLLATLVLTLLLGASLLASGIARIILAWSVKPAQPWIWLLLSGIVTLLLGLLILAHWPISSAFVLGMFLGLDLVMAGAGWIGLSLALHHRGEASPARTTV